MLKTLFKHVLIYNPIQFQSLIGMLKTFKSAQAKKEPSSRFQSLIGMLKTEYLFVSVLGHKMFQSLIGMLKTAHERTFADVFSEVSIPHRYAKNGDFFA